MSPVDKTIVRGHGARCKHFGKRARRDSWIVGGKRHGAHILRVVTNHTTLGPMVERGHGTSRMMVIRGQRIRGVTARASGGQVFASSAVKDLFSDLT
ncbi:hypothetical protein PoB_004562300 [Plakobranchus ocellatus]|uniref:Uncharacterized protein n=1 Tax=Plakobranchus ocellatus TaxID=259542 RepID=A0AAV4BHN6_9GAST|nr:hypothetical protein PoB_004562300 [Plakobranchus ocellatus]